MNGWISSTKEHSFQLWEKLHCYLEVLTTVAGYMSLSMAIKTYFLSNLFQLNGVQLWWIFFVFWIFFYCSESKGQWSNKTRTRRKLREFSAQASRTIPEIVINKLFVSVCLDTMNGDQNRSENDKLLILMHELSCNFQGLSRDWYPKHLFLWVGESWRKNWPRFGLVFFLADWF